jgi:hypothetical protein
MTEWLALQNPFVHPLHLFGLELSVAAAFFLTLGDALARYRRGDRWPLFQWVTALTYGVSLEILTYNTWDNFSHGQFTVQLYHHKLPLYVTLIYPAFHYTALKLVESWRLKLLPEALLVGFALVLIDAPFDTAGPDAGWWSWSPTDPNMAVRWLGVPITSYYWYLLFGALYAALLRLLRPKLEKRALHLLAAPLVGAAVIIVGCIAFIPFHLLKAAGMPPSAVVAAHLATCGVIAWKLRPAQATPLPRHLFASLLSLQLYPVLLLVALRPSLWPIKVAAAATALGVAMAMVAKAGVTDSSTAYSARGPSPDGDSSEVPTTGSLSRGDT